MSPQIACPSEERLHSFLRGSGETTELAELRSHLETCALCQDKVRNLTPRDTLAEHVSSDVSQGGMPTTDLPRSLASQLKTATRQRHPGDQSTVGAESNSTTSIEGFDFLAPAQEPDEIGRLGRYRVIRVLGQGGMGMVFLAHDPDLDRQVGLKVMLPNFAANETSKMRFLREAKAAAKVKSDHIVNIHQVGEDRGVPYLAMELLEGRPLDQFLATKPTLSLAQILRISRDIAKGLAAAHDKGLIHRDIKPANLWLDQGNADRVKILDFGLARAEKEDVHVTHAGTIVGTPAFMAPEQARGNQPVDARADLFSLGCVLYRLCVGHIPFRSDTTMGILLAIATEEPVSPAKAGAKVPIELSDLVMQLLEKDPVQRTPNAKAVISLLDAIEQKYGIETSGDSLVATNFAEPGSVPRNRIRWFAVAGAFVAIALAAILLLRRTSDGVVRIEGNDDSIQLAFGDGEVKAVSDYREPLWLKPGTQLVKIRRDGMPDFVFDSDKLVVANGDDFLLRVEVVADEVRLLRDGKSIDSFQLPNAGNLPAPPGGDYALRFGDGCWVETPIKYDGIQPITVEATIRSRFGTEGACALVSNLNMPERGNGGCSLHIAAGFFVFARNADFDEPRVRSQELVPTNKWIRVAGVWDGKELRLYQDGQPIGIAGKTEKFSKTNDTFTLLIGSERKDDEPDWFFLGDISEVRISKVARYAKAYQPKDRLAADADTLALYRFDEGRGKKLRDASGNDRHGKIVGAKWVSKNDADGDKSLLDPPPTTDFAVWAEQGAGVLAESLKLPKSGPITIEGYVTPRHAKPSESMHLMGAVNHAVGVNGSGRWSMVWATKNGNEQTNTGLFVENRRTHVAGVIEGRKMRLFVDGKLASELDVGELLPGTAEPFSIGGAKNWAGSFDEMRVSKIARYTKDFEPKPRFDADADTLALFHCDEEKIGLLIDSSGNSHHGHLNGTRFVKPGETPVEAIPRRGLKFAKATDAVRVPKIDFDGQAPVTLEGWIDLEKDSSSGIELFRLGDDSAFLLKRHGSGYHANITKGFVEWQTSKAIKGELHRREHVAVTWDGKAIRCFVNGKATESTTLRPGLANLRLEGGLSLGFGWLTATLDTVRISKSLRYSGDFSPPSRFEKDNDTLALYLFEEGEGNVLRDSSGHNRHGTITGAGWVNTPR